MQAALMRSSGAFTSRVAAPLRRVQAVVAPRPQTLAAPSFVGGSFRSGILAPSRPQGRGALVVVAGGNSMGNTLHGTRRARRRTSGFRTRMATANGRRVLAARRKRGRHNLCPASKKLTGGKK